MKIVLTGGGTGGHFYPIIAVVQEMRAIIRGKKLVDPELYFLAPKPYNMGLLFDNNIIYKKVLSGKRRRYFSILNFIDIFKLAIGSIQALITVFKIYPDVIFSKGGYGSLPVVLAGKILRIPIIIHESDSVPGKANLWAGKFAEKIAISDPESAKFFNKNKVALTGIPIRREVATKAPEGGVEYLNLEPNIPVILVLGGSQGAQNINDVIIEALPELISKYQIIHQTGKENFEITKQEANITIGNSIHQNRYKPFPYFNDLAMRMSAGVADIVITRAGSTTLAEIASWGLPSIVIPIPPSVSHDQRKNAFNYARSDGAIVIEEDNLNKNILIAEIKRILNDEDLRKRMEEGAKSMARPKAGEILAEEILSIALEHEK